MSLPNNMIDVSLSSKPDVSIQHNKSFNFEGKRVELIKSWQHEVRREGLIKEFIEKRRYDDTNLDTNNK